MKGSKYDVAFKRQAIRMIKDEGQSQSVANISQKIKKFKATIYSNHDYSVFPNILNRNFRVAAPNRVWLSDITYAATDEGWLYLAAVMDLYSG